MKPNLIRMIAVAALAALAAASQSQASSGGIYDVAKPAQGGCNCHGGALPENTTTQAVILGLPADGYDPARALPYDLTVVVVGVAIPAPAFSGFNLAASGGSFGGGADVQVDNRNQCQRLSQSGFCAYTPGSGECCSQFFGCFPCDEEAVANATHVSATLPAGRFVWTVEWTPPAAGGPVTFYLAGNVVNGVLGNDQGDLWSIMEPVAVPEKEAY